MREYAVFSLILFFLPSLSAQVVPANWQIVKDAKNACQLAVPPEWSLYGDSRSAAILNDTSTALAIVTSQPGQTFSPLTEFFQRVLNIRKEKLFENTNKRIFYQDKDSANKEDPSSYTFSVPGKAGTCSGHLTFLPSISEDVARKIALSLGPVPDTHSRKPLRIGGGAGWNPAPIVAVYNNVRLLAVFLAFFTTSGYSQDAREIVRRSVELDQVNWLRMADYTWVGRSRERHFDSRNHVTSEQTEAWETIVLDGEPVRRTLERDGKPLPLAEQRKQQQKLDRETAKLENETPAEKERRAADYEKTRRRERAFLLEIPDAFDLKLEGSDKIDGQDVWVISGVPKPGYHAKSHDGAALLKIRGKMWIEKTGYQWVRLEAQTTQTISFGLFLARLNPGATLVLEEMRVNDGLWLPKREYVKGSGRIGLVKRIAEDQEITWNDYKKFQVSSKIVPREP